MKTFLNIFKPAPHIPEITDQKMIQEKFGYWRVRIFYSIFIGYAFYYFSRKSFTFAMPGIIQELHFDKAELGIMSSLFALSYGASKFISGILSDQSNPRYFMAVGLIITGIFNILFGFSSTLFLFALFWGLNGWFQGFGWPPCVRIFTHWYSQSERGSWWSLWNVSQNIGAFLIPWIVGFCLQLYGWRLGLWVPGAICILGGLFLMNRLRDTPQSLGLPQVEKIRNDWGDKRKEENEEKELTSKQLIYSVLENKSIWLLAFAYFFIYLLRSGISDWTALFLIEERAYSRLGASGAISFFEIGGFLGSLSAGFISDRIFSARRGPVNAIYASGLLMTVLCFWLIPIKQETIWLDTLMISMMGFFTFGPQMLIGVAACEIAHKKASATATGLIGWVAYTGSASAGYPLGKIIDYVGWNGFFITLTSCALFAVLFLIPLWGLSRRKVAAA